tara:strand:- start:9282 stop:10349 length:1068 start_codon:yes stop_codon:yes gene_type:complete
MKAGLKIAQVAPLYESVPPQTYGGTERVVKNLVEGLSNLGHEITLFASGDSVTTSKLIDPCPSSLRLDWGVRDKIVPHITMLQMLCEIESEFDLIHFHLDYLHLPLSGKLRTPNITTIHSRLDLPELVQLYSRFPKTNFVSISHAQRGALSGNNWVGNVYHGLDGNSFAPSYDGGRHLTFLGRMSPDKNPEEAIQLAIKTNLPIKIAAKIDPEDRPYYENKIMPLLNHPLVEFIGEVGEAKKIELLRNSLALVFPIKWPEPFGMVLIEAMACGTPVIAFNEGSVPEIIDEGVTGIVVQSIEEAVDKMKHLELIDRKLVRRRFEERFEQNIMALNYERIYRDVLTPETSIDQLYEG